MQSNHTQHWIISAVALVVVTALVIFLRMGGHHTLSVAIAIIGAIGIVVYIFMANRSR